MKIRKCYTAESDKSGQRMMGEQMEEQHRIGKRSDEDGRAREPSERAKRKSETVRQNGHNDNSQCSCSRSVCAVPIAASSVLKNIFTV